MAVGAKFIFKVLSPRIVAKAMATLDKSTAVIVSACWLAALVTLILAVFAVHGAVSAKKEAADAATVEPVLPQAVNAPMNVREIQPIVDRLQRQFPDVKIDLGPNQALVVKCNDGSKFHQWITALGYIDTMAPQYRWALGDFCVGVCQGDLMKATVSGHRVTFSLPQPK
jgi:hypothetical protein